MSATAWLWLAAIPAGLAVLYGLHRLCLSLEERGWLYYLHKKPDSSAASSFVALHQAIDPTAKHVFHVGEQRRSYSEDEAAGGPDDGDPHEDTAVHPDESTAD